MLTEDEQEAFTEEQLQKFCLQEKINRGTVNRGSEVIIYEFCNYIHWAVSKESIVVWVDGYFAGEGNKTFVSTGFPYSVFHNYLALYLYYISELLQCDELEQIVEEAFVSGDREIVNENRDKILRLHTELKENMADGKYKQLDTVLRDFFCEKQYSLTQRLENIVEKVQARMPDKMKYDVFISYRHDGGQYMALLLYDYLQKKGISVFWDKQSLRAGHYEEQIYSVIQECRNILVILSPNCIERLQEENDWVRKELAYAFKMKSKVLMVAMEGVEFPKESEMSKLPKEIQQLVKCHGVETEVAYFDSVIDRIIKMIK